MAKKLYADNKTGKIVKSTPSGKTTEQRLAETITTNNSIAPSLSTVDTNIKNNIASFNQGDYGSAFANNSNLDGYGSMNGVYYEFYKDGTKKYIDEKTGADITASVLKNDKSRKPYTSTIDMDGNTLTGRSADEYLKFLETEGITNEQAAEMYGTSTNVVNAEKFLADESNAAKKTSLSDEALATIYEFKNRPQFEYDPTKDALYQNAINNAMKGGQMAMQDTIGQASALTGGYGSSYATSAANQAYNAFIEDAYDNMADYYNMALNAYNAEGQRLLDQYSMLSDQDRLAWEKDQDYWNRQFQEGRAARADFESDRDFAEGVRQFDTMTQLDRDKLKEQIREFDIGADLDERQFEEFCRQFDINTAISEKELKQKWRMWKAEHKEGIREFDETMDLKERQFAEDQEQNDISNSYRASKGSGGGGSSSGGYPIKESSTKTSRYTENQFSDVIAGVIKAAGSGEEAALDYIETQNDIKPFTDEELKSLYGYVDKYVPQEGTVPGVDKGSTSSSRIDPSSMKWSIGPAGNLVNENGDTIKPDVLINEYMRYLNDTGASNKAGKLELFKEKIINLING